MCSEFAVLSKFSASSLLKYVLLGVLFLSEHALIEDELLLTEIVQVLLSLVFDKLKLEGYSEIVVDRIEFKGGNICEISVEILTGLFLILFKLVEKPIFCNIKDFCRKIPILMELLKVGKVIFGKYKDFEVVCVLVVFFVDNVLAGYT